MDNLIYYIYVPVLIVLVTAFLHSVNIRYHEKRRIYNEVVKRVHEAFNPEFIAIASNRTDIYVPNIFVEVTNALGRHEAIIIEFSTVLNWRQRKKLHKIWSEYSYIYHEYGSHSITYTGRGEILFRKQVKEFINEIFNIAKYR